MENREKYQQDLSYLQMNIERLNAQWSIQDQVIDSSIPLIGSLSIFFKRLIRKLTYWLIRPYWDQQIAFNQIVTAAVSDLYRLASAVSYGAENLDQCVSDSLAGISGHRVIQLVSSLNYGDAVGNEVIAFKRTLQENGYATEIYANNIHKRLPPGTARYYKDIPPLRADDLVIYHFASECSISQDIRSFPCKVVLRYHNVTPPSFFHGFDANAEKATANGLRQVKEIMPYIDYCLPASKFSMHDLQAMGYKCPMTVLPILIRFEDYRQEADQNVVEKYSDGRTNVLFVGRMAPNKKVEDVISAFAEYKEAYDPNARLFLIGSYQETDKYYQFLQEHIKKIGVHDVIFSGHISFQAILAYYKIANVFLCMSEHEGFCVPLIEAQRFGVPVLAYASCAVPDTMGESGVLFYEKDPAMVACLMDSVLHNRELRSAVLEKQTENLQRFSPEEIRRKLSELLGKWEAQY